jgi:ribose transport system substrate-binding protein
MKKFLAVLLTISLMCCIFVGCAQKQTSSGSASSTSGSTASASAASSGSTAASAETSAASQSTGSSSASSSGKKYKIGFSNVWVGNTYGIQCVNELETYLRSNDEVGEYYIYNADNDVNKQISDIEDLISKGVDMLILQPISAESVAAVVEEAHEAGIVVVDCTSPLADATDEYDVSVVAKDYDFGYIGAKWLCEKLNGKTCMKGSKASRFFQMRKHFCISTPCNKIFQIKMGLYGSPRSFNPGYRCRAFDNAA